jgi:hypothetical protein
MVIAGVKQGSGTLGPCLRTAQAKREIVPGKHTLILQWKIEPNGTVTDPRLVGPANLMGTSLPACFSNAMRKWQFPATPKGAPVRNYPLGPISVTSQ